MPKKQYRINRLIQYNGKKIAQIILSRTININKKLFIESALVVIFHT